VEIPALARYVGRVDHFSCREESTVNCRFVKIVAWGILGLLAGATARAQPAANPIAASLQPFVDRHVLAGAVTLVASPQGVLSLEAVGYADIAAKKPMRTDNLFWIASMSKPMTAAALMMLVDEGKVSVDDPVERYLPEFKEQMLSVQQEGGPVLRKPARPITLKDVLSHTSGLPFMSKAEHKIDVLSLREAALSYAKTPLKSEPGTRYEYSNAGINTVGRIIEVVGHMPYEAFMEQRLFKPLGMTDTTFRPSEEQVQRLAKSYKPSADKTGLQETTVNQLTYPLSDPKRRPCPAGGLFSTATDVSVFCRMILQGGVYQGKRYLSEPAVRQMTSTQTPAAPGKGKDEGGYGFGWSTTRRVHSKTDPVIVGACGHGGAYSTDMWLDPERRLIMVFMVQHAAFAGKDGAAILQTFRKAAEDAFSPPAKQP
jgi:CubicO group peptidase (beta-lactamase class C family)